MRIADLLAGSGIRSLRFLKELKKGKVQELYVNDAKENFPKVFKENLKLNKINCKNVTVSNEEANLFLLKNEGFDYIEIDPFGSPNHFLANSVARISRDGILAITATDTAALTGTYPKVTRRKYWAEPLRNYLMHEIGLRILIRKIQLQGIQFEKAFLPILSYSKDHYFRVYVQNEKGKEKCDGVVKQHQYFLFCLKCLNFKCSKFNQEKCSCGKEFLFAGPLWTGSLSDTKLLEKMVSENPFPEEQAFLESLLEESKSSMVGFHDLNEIAHQLRTNPPKMEPMLRKLNGFRTHFSTTGIKSERKVADVIRAFK
jgi:tRNA (guanine26-N2/guanine27-N2)-dimethyltransferase